MKEFKFGSLKIENEIKFGKIKVDIQKVYPELEDLEVIPTGEEQTFKSSKYGYDNVTVKGVETEELNVIPTTENQVNEGLYRKVTVVGDEDLKPENIKQGTSIFGVEGNAKTANFKITNTSYLFYNKSRLEYVYEMLSLCENVTDAQYMFYNCYATPLDLDLSNFDTNKVTNMSYMFNMCSQFNILGLENFNTSNVINMQYMFNGCMALIKLNLSNFDTSKVTNMSYMFSDCEKLTDLDLSGFDASKLINISYMFNDCLQMTKLNFMNNLGKGYTASRANYSSYKLDLSECVELSHDSLMSVINNLYDLNLTYNVANGGTLYTQQLVLGSTNLSKLTAEEINIAVSKGWSVS